MDILNELPPERFSQIDDLLAFVSIYDDDRRTGAYLNLLNEHRNLIRGKVCVDAGCGFGIFSEYLAKLGAKKVYAVEKNPHLIEIARLRLRNYPQIELIQADISQFQPAERVDVLVHEFFGQLLFDEDLLTLQHLAFQPQRFLPNRALLRGGLADRHDFVDRTVTPAVLSQLEGVLVSGLFDDADVPLQFEVMEWTPDHFMRDVSVDISDKKGDLLYLGLEIYDDNRQICRAGECWNWSYVWTPRAGDVFTLQFSPSERGASVFFDWIK